MIGPTLGLLTVALLWGTTFVAIKAGLDDASPLLFVGIRFGIGALASSVLLPRRAEIRAALGASIPLGIVLAVGYASQTLGLQTTTPARSAFITGVNVALVPLWAILILHRRARWLSLIGLLITLPGLWLLTSPGSQTWGIGDAWTLLCAAFFGLHVVLVNLWGPRHDGSALLVSQLSVTALVCLAAAWVFETPRLHVTPQLGLALLVTAIFATTGTTWLQLRYQPRVDPTRAALIYATEPLFAALFSLWFFGELLPVLGWIGGSLILSGTLLSEFGSRKRKGEAAPATPPDPAIPTTTNQP